MISNVDQRNIVSNYNQQKKRGNNFTIIYMSNRVEKYERDLKRWEFMDEEQKRQVSRLQEMNDKYLTGRKNQGGSAYNILSLTYDRTPEGEYLK